MKIVRVTVTTLPDGTEVVTLWTDALDPGWGVQDPATFDMKVPRGKGVAWVKENLPGVPVEHNDCYSGATKHKFVRGNDGE